MSTFWKRLRCFITFAHIDPPVFLIGQRVFVCKRCLKVLK
jgi:hypothetical protein